MTDISGDADTNEPPISYALGVVYCLLAAVGYTLANIALRWVSDADPIWVTAIKAVPTVIGMAPAVFATCKARKPLAPQSGSLMHMVIGALIGQLLGNCCFQYSLDIVGLALAVPICLGTMVIGGAICGKLFLGETVSARTAVAIVILISAAIILSLGSEKSAVQPNTSALKLASGVISVAISGVAYAFFGTMVRRSLLRGMSVSTTMMVSGVVGSVALTVIAWYRIGISGMIETTGEQWLCMCAAGLFNLIAFFLLTVALQVVSVVVVNLLNVVQIALAAVAGYLLFGEEFTTWMGVGIALTMIGLMVLGKRKKETVEPV